jgi:electron transport complex protein RnfB
LKCPTNAIPSDVKELEKARIIEEKCIGCGICKKVCPVNAVPGEMKQKYFIIEEKCIGCEKCFEKCPVKAIEMEKMIKKT